MLLCASVVQSAAQVSAGRNVSAHAGGTSHPTIIPDAIAASRASAGSCLTVFPRRTKSPITGNAGSIVALFGSRAA